MSYALLLLIVSTLAARAAGFTADSAHGERLFQTLSCIQCHSLNGTGGTSAPDLGRMVDRGFTAATLAATMWNHAPVCGRPCATGKSPPAISTSRPLRI